MICTIQSLTGHRAAYWQQATDSKESKRAPCERALFILNSLFYICKYDLVLRYVREEAAFISANNKDGIERLVLGLKATFTVAECQVTA
jgi:hypothetical protein